MAYGAECLKCGAPIRVDMHSVTGETEIRCPSCGFPTRVAIVNGAISLTPAPIAIQTAPKRRNAKARAAIYSALPILIPVACVCVVVAAIAIRELREAAERRQRQHKLAVIAERNQQSTTKSKAVAPRAKVEVQSQLAKAPHPHSVAPGLEALKRQHDLAVLQEVIAAAPRNEVADTVPAKKSKSIDEHDLAVLQDVIGAAPPNEAADTVPTEKSKSFDEVEIFRKLREAKQKFRETVAADLPRVTKECQEIVKRVAAQTGNLELARGLLKELDEFKESGKIPTAKQFEGVRKSHLDVRKTAALELHGAYKSTIDILVKELEIERAINTKDEMEEFVQKERQALGIAEAINLPAMRQPVEGDLRKPLIIDLQVDRQTREYDDPDPTGKLVLKITELVSFPNGAKLQGEKASAPVGTPLIIEFADMAGPQIEVRCVRNSTARKIQLQVESVFQETGKREFELTFPRLDKLELSSRTSLTRLRNEIPSVDDAMRNVRATADAEQSRISGLLGDGKIDALQADSASKRAMVAAQNTLNALDRRLMSARQELTKLSARLGAVPEVRSFMQSIHQQGAIKYTISIEREGKEFIIVDAK